MYSCMLGPTDNNYSDHLCGEKEGGASICERETKKKEFRFECVCVCVGAGEVRPKISD